MNEVLRVGLRLLEEKLSFLCKALTEGEEGGFTNDSFEGLIQELNAEDLK